MDIGAVVHPWRRDATSCWLYGVFALGMALWTGSLPLRYPSDDGCITGRWGFLARLCIPRLVGCLACTGCLDRRRFPGHCGPSTFIR